MARNWGIVNGFTVNSSKQVNEFTGNEIDVRTQRAKCAIC